MYSMMLLAQSQQIREADRIMIHERSYPGLLLMEHAARASTDRLLTLFSEKNSFWILAGPGNNGGDGLAMARMLHLAGRHVHVWLAQDPALYTGDAAIQRDILQHLPVPTQPWTLAEAKAALDSLPEVPVWVDALLGTGVTPPVRGAVAKILRDIADMPGPRVAIDLPSGLNADSGEVVGDSFPADHTLTFQLAKVCHYVYPAAGRCGQVAVLDIGIWPEVIAQLGIRRQVTDLAWVKSHWKTPDRDAHKGTQGHVLVVGGSAQYRGAMALTAAAALRAGAGLVSLAVPEEVIPVVLQHVPEAMCLPGISAGNFKEQDAEAVWAALQGKQVLVIGPGMGQGEEQMAFLLKLLPRVEVPVLIDADALNLLAQVPDWPALRKSEWLITPHPGEMARLTGSREVLGRRLETAETFAKTWGVTILLKGAYSLIAAPDGRTWVNPTGNPGMATGGSGDVLSGIAGGLLAQGYDPTTAAVLAAWYHGQAGDAVAAVYGEAGVTAGRMVEAIRVGE